MTVTVTYDVAAGVEPTTISNTVNITSDEDTTTANDTVDVSVVADLSVTKSSSPDPYIPGSPISYLIQVSNAGPSLVSELILTETLPLDLTNVVYSPSEGTYDPGTGLWTGLDLGVGESVTLVVDADVASDSTAPLVNIVTVMPPESVTDPDLSNNTASDQNPSDSTSDLSLIKTADNSTVSPGSAVAYTIVVTNEGPGIAVGAQVVDQIPSEMVNPEWNCAAAGSAIASCSSDAGTGDIDITVDLGPGDTATVTVTGNVATGATGQFDNSAQVISEDDPDPTNNVDVATVNVTAISDLRVEKSASTVTSSPGDEIVYTVTVHNDGPSSAPGVAVVDELPSGAQPVTVSTSVGVCTVVNGTVECDLGTLQSGSQAVVTITVRTDMTVAGSTIVNTASATSDNPDPNPSNDISSVSVDISPGATSLPFTGSTPLPKLFVALAAMISGVAMVALGRREDEEPGTV